MPTRRITIEGRSWRVFPSGTPTQSNFDEFALLFVSGEGEGREVRVTRYSPNGTLSRERSLVELSDAKLESLFRESQPSFTSPEAGYAP